MLERDFVVAQLKSLPKTIGLKVEKEKAWIKCPWHKNGRENTPSLKINLSAGRKYGVGVWNCFGCGIQKELKATGQGNAGWATLAAKLGLDGGIDGKKQQSKTISAAEVTGMEDEFFSTRDTKQLAIELDRERLLTYPKHPMKAIWRTIPGKIVRGVGGIDAKNSYGYSRLYLPIMVNGEWCSGIYCTYNKAKLAYIYDGDKRVNRSLFPYDYMAKHIAKRRKARKKIYVVVVEGPRDALNLISNGIYALAVLGGITAFNKDKLKLILDLDPDLVVIASDPDEIGDKLAKAIQRDCKKHLIPWVHFEMKSHFEKVKNGKQTVKIKKKLEDPGDLKPKRIDDLKRLIKEYL